MARPIVSDPSVPPFTRFLLHPRLGLWLALLALVLTAPSLWLGFHLDDHMHRYMLSELPGGRDLREAYQSPFGIANGQPDSILWQTGQGYAPWWTDGGLLVSLWRPLSEALHRLDVALWMDSAVAMHAHSLLWWALLVLAVTRLYRGLMGTTTVAGLAALLYAVDHTHGFAVGWIANRNVLVATLFSVLALDAFHRASQRSGGRRSAASLGWLACALLAGEGAIAVCAYLFAHALFMQSGSLLRRFMRVAPAAALVAVWRIGYQALGRGAHGSGLYLDPVREPARFLAAAMERGPVLLLGELGLPPAEAYVFFPALNPLHLGFAVGVGVALALVSWPMLRRDACARFWALGTLLSLLPACATHPNNRLLFFAGLGAMGLLSQLWHGYVGGARWLPPQGLRRRAGRAGVAALAGFHLVISPLLLPIATLGVAVTAPLQRAVEGLLRQPGLGGRQLVLLDAPDYFATKLLLPTAALQNLPAPRSIVALSYGAVAPHYVRQGERTLIVDYGDGLLARPTDWLYSHPDVPMREGYTRDLPGLHLQVLQVTGDGRPMRVRFDFDSPLDAGDRRWVRWRGDRFEPFTWAQAGQELTQPPALLPLLSARTLFTPSRPGT